jgi:hypothetical protein
VITATGLLLAFAPQLAVTDQHKLRASDNAKDDYLGWSVDLLDDRAVAGAPRHHHPVLGLPTGAAYVFGKEGDAWQEQGLLLPSNVGSAASKLWRFGESVACDSQRVIVGAPNASSATLAGSGLAFIYVRAGVTWIEESILDPQEPASNFGHSVDIDASTAIAGSPRFSGSAPHEVGAAYVFERAVSAWVKQARLRSDDIAPGDDFGRSVIYLGEWAFVGAPHADGCERDTGAVYVFRRYGTEWSQSQKLFAADGRTADQFGASIAFDGTLVVGAPYNDEGLWTDVGAAYVFQAQGSLWVEQQRLVPKGHMFDDRAGTSVAVRAHRIAVGAPEGGWFEPGHIVLYSNTPNGWIEHRELSPVGASPDEDVGRSLAMDRSQVMTGAPAADGVWNSMGAGYVLDVQSQGDRPTFYCTAKQDSKGCVPRIYHIGQPSVSATKTGEIHEVGGWELQAKKSGLLAYSTIRGASAPFAGGFLCIEAPIVRTPLTITTEMGLAAPCTGAFSFDFNAWIASGVDPALSAGQSVWMQYFYRDPTGAPGNEVGLSEGLHVVIGP